MSDRPTEQAWKHRPLIALVEVEPNTGVFVVDPRITVVRCLIGSSERINEAELAVWLGPTLPAAGDEEAMNGLACLNGAYRYGFGGSFITPDQAIVIARRRAEEIDPGAGTSLAAEYEPFMFGFCDIPEYAEDGKAKGSSNSLRLVVKGSLLRMSDAEHSQIRGRLMRTAAEQDLLDAAQARSATTAHGTYEDATTVVAFPTVFNPGGKANCAAAPITATLEGASVPVHIFTHDNDPDAVPWTYARVLRYLVYWHTYLDSVSGTGPVRDGNVFAITEALINTSPGDRPERPVAYEDAWEFAALGVPANLNVDGMNIGEALIAVAEASGTRFWTRTEWDDDDQPVDKLFFWPRGAGEKKWLHRTPFMDGYSAREVLEANDVNAYTVRMDYRDVVPNLKLLGDVRRYEITTELVPGWLPDSNLDNISGESAITAAMGYAQDHWNMPEPSDLVDDPWYVQYHKSGSQAGQYAQVGRRWILNTAGRYRATENEETNYARTVEPFDADAYASWEPSACGIEDLVLDDGTLTYVAVAAGQWVRRPRPFLPCFSADKQRTSLGIVVHVSFDSGSNWHRIPELCPVALGNDSGIQFVCEDLTRIDDPIGPMHFWEAIIKGTARVRVTAVIEGDDRLEPPASSGTGDASSSLHRQIDVSSRFKSNDRHGGNSIYSGSSFNDAEDSRVDVEAIAEYAKDLLEILAVRQQAGAPRIPWITTDYMPGDSIVGIEGMGFEFQGHAVAVQRRYPDVIGVEYVGSQTALALDDWRVFDDFRTAEED